LFDLDGVLTPTATLHAAAWKQLFDDFLRARSASTGEPFVPFDIRSDYVRYVDGRPRQDGVLSFLAARGITLPLGNSANPPGEQTVHALGHLKDTYFLQQLREHGVQPFEGAAELLRTLRAHDVRTAVVTSSKNGKGVIEAAGITDLLDTRVDGNDIEQLNLRGKPAPDGFLEAARRLRVAPARTVVVEDAIAGVHAAHAGRFGYVIGIDHGGQAHALRECGADAVVDALAQIHVAVEPPSTWSLVYHGFDPAREGLRESLCALGNGYFTTRGALPWARADGTHYPGTYLAGGYNRLRSTAGGRTVENEALVNFPNWLSLALRLGTADWLDLRRVHIVKYRQELDLQCGVLERTMTLEDADERRTTLRERRFVSMANMHVSALEIAVTAENWSGPLAVCSGIDGRIVNSGARLYEKFNNRHLEPMSSTALAEDGVQLIVQTNQSKLRVAQAARTRLLRDGKPVETARRPLSEPGYIGQHWECAIAQGETLVLEKLAVLHTSRDRAISEPDVASRKSLMRMRTFDIECKAHVRAWKHLWRRFDVHLRPAAPQFNLNVPMLLRLNMFHLLQATSLNSIGLDIGVPARAWTGEAYEGHIFWDEIFIFPTLTFRTPEIARSLLMYRYHRLDEARAAAVAASYQGAMFPWQSGSDGQEETQELNFNHRSERWLPDNSYLQRHVGSAVAWNVWQYFQITHDAEFLQFYGAEMILEVARFWASIAHFNAARGRYEIHGVMGPDEFHEAYPDAAEPGLNNNAYTNVMAVWVLLRAQDTLDALPDIRRAELMTRCKIGRQEIALWADISRKMFVPFHDDGIISQFEGYELLRELDWQSYRERYGNIQRLELILEAENDSANRYKVSKQADVLMLFHLFSSEELRGLFERLGYAFAYETIPRNVAYYDCRSTHGSTLSRVVHAWVLARSDRKRAMTYYEEALQSDTSDIQQGTTAEGVHLGAMAGTVDLIQRVSTGAEVTGDVLRLNPRLPEQLARLDMRIRYRGHTLDLRLTRKTLTVRGRESGLAPIRLGIRDEVHEFRAGSVRTFELGTA
jgi:beta-phosphoglucomutase family hydrolase